MSLDLYIERRKKNDPNAPWEELFYARKFWELLHASFVREYNDSKNSCYVEARINSEEDFNELIDIATHNRNYFGNYESVASICEARDDFLENKDNYIYRLTADW